MTIATFTHDSHAFYAMHGYTYTPQALAAYHPYHELIELRRVAEGEHRAAQACDEMAAGWWGEIVAMYAKACEIARSKETISAKAGKYPAYEGWMVNIATLKDRANLQEIAARFVSIKKKGRLFLALCPFHNEDTPSFTIYPDKNTYYCYGCHAHGDVIDFWAKVKHMGDFGEAVRSLAAEIGMRWQEPVRQEKGWGVRY